VGKGTTIERLKIIQRSVFFLGQKFAFRAGNSAPRARISAPGQNFRGSEIPEFLALRNLAKSFTKCCGATFGKGARNSGLAEYPGAGNFIISGPRKFS
jgi:hypothetical protein